LGLGFVLLVGAVILGGAAVVSAVVLGLWSLWNHRAVIGRREVLKAVAAAALPIFMFGYAGAAFVGYAIWCEILRGVDPGIGDSWQVPVGNDHYFCMIDVPAEGYLLKGGCSGAPIVDGITELGSSDDLVFGNSKSSGPFLLDTRTGALQTFASVETAVARITPRPNLRGAGDFYIRQRWGRADAIAVVLIGVPALAITVFWYLWFIRARPAGRRGLR
jgi:hypothetical protein